MRSIKATIQHYTGTEMGYSMTWATEELLVH